MQLRAFNNSCLPMDGWPVKNYSLHSLSFSVFIFLSLTHQACAEKVNKFAHLQILPRKKEKYLHKNTFRILSPLKIVEPYKYVSTIFIHMYTYLYTLKCVPQLCYYAWYGLIRSRQFSVLRLYFRSNLERIIPWLYGKKNLCIDLIWISLLTCFSCLHT